MSDERLNERLTETMRNLESAYRRGSHQAIASLQQVKGMIELEMQLRRDKKDHANLTDGVIFATGQSKPKEEKSRKSPRRPGAVTLNQRDAMQRQSAPKGE